MSFDIERFRDATERVRKFVRKNSRKPRSDSVHKFRTSVRSLETTFTTLHPGPKRRMKRLLADLEKVRRGAGKVRDMDVLTSDVLKVNAEGEQDCLVELLQYLGAKRDHHAGQLSRTVERTNARLRRSLKQSYARVEDVFEKAKRDPADSDALPTTIRKAIKLSFKLKKPSRLDRDNLHGYRLKVKELRNVLQLSSQTAGLPFVEKLGDVKDAIGEWHDWDVLSAIAERVFDHPSCSLLRQLRSIRDSKYARALFLTNSLRNTYLQSVRPKRDLRRGTAPWLSDAALTASSGTDSD
jgi:CHAD domain-containing protein